MGIHHVNDNVIFGLSVPLARFRPLFAEFIRRYPQTLVLEDFGSEFVANELSETQMPQFITRVCEWGGYAGIAGRILKRNALPSIQAAMREAVAYLAQEPCALGAALAAVNKLHSLGTPSFASKHLRFLRPDICPVYDAVLRNVLPYTFDPDGYEEFAADCMVIAGLLKRAHVENPAKRSDGAWYAADVEAALFAHVNAWIAQE